jgi:hypothetical protein
MSNFASGLLKPELAMATVVTGKVGSKGQLAAEAELHIFFKR